MEKKCFCNQIQLIYFAKMYLILCFAIFIVSFPEKRRVESGFDDSVEESPRLKLVKLLTFP